METEKLHDLWDYLHRHPELSWEEEKTTQFLMNYLEDAGLNPIRFKEIPGLYVDIGRGRPKVGLRADMDALLQEVDGELQPNHSCGHDAHMAIVTRAIIELKEKANQLNGTVRAIFQPAEEVGEGAIRVIEEGIADDLDYLFGLHLRPANEIAFPNCAPGIQHGSCAFIRGQIIGLDHHGARPYEGINAIEVGGNILTLLQQIHTNPHVPASVKMTNFHAGTESTNIIPGSAEFALDLRAQTNEMMDEIKSKVENILDNIDNLYDEVEVTYEYEDNVPAAVINTDAEGILAKAISNALGDECLKPRLITTGADDFHYYTLLRPQIKATMLALGADVNPGLHAPNMTFNKKALDHGVQILKETCLELLLKK